MPWLCHGYVMAMALCGRTLELVHCSEALVGAALNTESLLTSEQWQEWWSQWSLCLSKDCFPCCRH